MLEVTTAIGVLLVVLMLTLTLGQPAVQRLREDWFIDGFAHEWQLLVSQVRMTGHDGKMAIQREAGKIQVIYTIDKSVYKRKLIVPAGIQVKNATAGGANLISPIKVPAEQFFTTPQALIFLRANGKEVKLTYQLGWGVLIRK